MSFSGGGESGGTLAHVHSNAANEGGSLNETTLIQNIPLFALTIGV